MSDMVLCPNTRALVELELQRELDVVRVRAVLVFVEAVVENGEDALRWDRVGRVGRDGGTYEKAQGRHQQLVGEPEARECEGVLLLRV